MSSSVAVEQLLERLALVQTQGAYRSAKVKCLDQRTLALVVIGAAVCTDAPTRTFQSLIGSALKAGAAVEEVVGALLAVAPAAGEPRIVAVAPKIALALDYDVDEAFERE
jgi:alkylhydroperoxidase/carboxymuconolactone decarboxylase family protein YurZ